MNLLEPVSGSPTFKWDMRTARHLLNRAGFGAPPTAVAKLAAMKHADAVAAFVDYERFPDTFAAPDWLPEPVNYRELRRMAAVMTEQEKQSMRRQAQNDMREAMSRLQIWWLNRMCRTQRPLEEKMTLFWHGHFATSAEKVKEPTSNYQLNQIFRRNATGNFRTLVLEVGRSPAMMRYLDQQQSSKQKPNENWARELMELFTLGIGSYTENDVKEAARAFTGWSVRDEQFQFMPARHDTGPKTFLGRTGNFKGEDIVDIILEQPACAEFLCNKLWKFFAYDDPEPEVVRGLAATLRNSKYDLKPVLQQMFSSQAFYQDKAVNTQVKSPAQLVVNLLTQLDAPISEKPPVAQLAMRAMGQALFYPPNVKGWDGGRAWINTNTLLVRYNFANYLVAGVVPDFKGQRGGAGGKSKELERMARQDERLMSDDTNGMMGAGMDATEQRENAKESPAGQDAMPKDVPATTLYSALRDRKSGMLESRQMQRAPFRAREFFAQYHGMTSEEIIDALAGYFVGFPLELPQKQKLLNALAQGLKPDQPVPVIKMAEEDLRATVQLLLSTAEYQVC